MKTSFCGEDPHPAAASLPLSGSISTFTMPSGASNGFTRLYSRYAVARFMNSVQIGSADCAPSIFTSR